ncbi:MAG: hypothetical protein KGJ88_05595, partial [Verrucomicrobiota bacterium]|nr:hypothetical protein [Verrucomicrobiota bacterium]
PDHLIYYLTFNGGDVNGNYNTNENAVWVYNDQTSNNVEIQAGYPGFPDNIAVDAANGRYYFTIGRDGTGAPTPANYQAIYDGALSSTNAPTLLYTPVLSGEDGPGQINAGNVALQGIFVEDSPVLAAPSTAIYLIGGSHIPLSPALAAADPSSTLLSGATIAVVGGSFSGDGDALSAVTNGTAITGAYVATNETLTLSGADTLANYQEVLRTVAFSSSNPDPTQAGAHPSRTISWTITDGGLAGPAVSSTLLLSTASAPATNHIAAIAVTNGWVLLFTGATNQDFVAQFAPAVTGPWTDLSPLLTPNVSGLVEYNDQITAPGPSMRFYRVRTGP